MMRKMELRDLPSTSTLVLLGCTHYAAVDDEKAESNHYESARSSFEKDFRSRVWLTYRRGFKMGLLKTAWRTDAGWGCTLRSAQMMVANALSIHTRGRDWRRSVEERRRYDAVEPRRQVEEPVAAAGEEGAHTHTLAFISEVVDRVRNPVETRTKRGCDSQTDVIRLFADDDRAPFSIFRLCEAAQTCGVWFEPSTMCRVFVRLIKDHLSRDIAAHVVESGTGRNTGGIPTLDARTLRSKMTGGRALIVFVPMVLGAGRTVNARYLSQLREVLGFQQSIGIIGGRPNASLYLVGHSDDDVFFYLDPHTVQVASDLDDEIDVDTYYCSVALHTRGELLDPTMTLGFYCRNESALDDLLSAVSAMSDSHRSAPILHTTMPNADNFVNADDEEVNDAPSTGDIVVDEEFHDWEFV
jgi:cysteine protease ATG4